MRSVGGGVRLLGLLEEANDLPALIRVDRVAVFEAVDGLGDLLVNGRQCGFSPRIPAIAAATDIPAPIAISEATSSSPR